MWMHSSPISVINGIKVCRARCQCKGRQDICRLIRSHSDDIDARSPSCPIIIGLFFLRSFAISVQSSAVRNRSGVQYSMEEFAVEDKSVCWQVAKSRF